MLKIAHRGARLQATENTLTAFEKAIESGANMVELDVQLSKDGQMMVIHDPTVDRTTDGTGFVKDLTYEELRKFRTAEGDKIPTLEEVYELCIGKIQVLTEIKAMKCLEPLARLIERMGNRDEVVVQSFLHGELKEMKKFDGLVRTAPLFDELLMDGGTIRDYLVSLDANGANMNFGKVREDLVNALHEAGLFLYVWGGSEEDMRDLGADGITMAM